MKKMIAVLLCFIFIFSMGTPAYASETTPETTNGTNVSPRGYDIPTTPHALYYTATVTNLEAQHITYTRYYFTPENETLTVVGTFWPTGSDTTTSRKVKVEIYKIGDSRIVDSWTSNYFTGNCSIDHSFTGLQSGNYYLVVRNLTSSLLDSERWISGSFLIY